MVNRKGYIKTLEAVIAVILIVIISYTLVPKNVITNPDIPLVLSGAMNFINEKIEFNETLREGIIDTQKGFLMGTPEDIESLISDGRPKNYDFTCAICSNVSCFSQTPLEKSIFVDDIFIASSGTEQNPKLVRIWFWEKPTLLGQPFLNECQVK